ncbi:alpha/beta hydrolase [uncultured Psychroserpens sp.]|uniref:alpha/beta fold hydrolase n=1 Tax=uncultured Psychroserpens sp. TaxID=255436 RepID=UPI002615380A|nr:alpha/beta hydrolase [uncultured Psychroserpens sp.]
MKIFTTLITSMCFLIHAYGQSKVQDSTLNNLILPNNYLTTKLGMLGDVKKTGTGDEDVILLAGWGFGANIFDDFVSKNSNKYTMYAVTFPGFSETKPYPIPKTGTSYGKQIWTSAIVDGVINLIANEKLEKPTIIGHFITGTQVAFRIGLHYPNLIEKIIIVGGSAKSGSTDYPKEPTLEERIKVNDTYYAPKWFKTVTKKTWDTGNYPPEIFSREKVLAQQLWDMAAKVPMQIMIHYILEYYASDISLEFKNIKVPTLLLIPSFNEEIYKKYNYLKPSFVDCWKGADENKLITTEIVPRSNVFIMNDQPDLFSSLVSKFIYDN